MLNDRCKGEFVHAASEHTVRSTEPYWPDHTAGLLLRRHIPTILPYRQTETSLRVRAESRYPLRDADARHIDFQSVLWKDMWRLAHAKCTRNFCHVSRVEPQGVPAVAPAEVEKWLGYAAIIFYTLGNTVRECTWPCWNGQTVCAHHGVI